MKHSRKQGRLSNDDLMLWNMVAERTEKLDLKSLFTADLETTAPSLPKKRELISTVLGKPRPKSKSKPHSLMPSLPGQIKAHPVQMDVL